METFQQLSGELDLITTAISRIIEEQLAGLRQENQAAQAMTSQLIQQKAPREYIALTEAQNKFTGKFEDAIEALNRLLLLNREKIVNLDAFMAQLSAHVYQQGDKETPFFPQSTSSIVLDVQNPMALVNPRPIDGSSSPEVRPLFSLKARKIPFSPLPS